MNIAQIHHIAIICSDYSRSKHFYVNLLGFPVIRETFRESRQSYKLDLQVNEQTQIELFSFPNPPERPTSPEACGLRHLAFAVADLDASVAELITNEIDVEPIRVDEPHIPPFPLAQEEYHCFNSASSTADRWSPKTGVFDAAHPLNSPLASPHSAPRSGRP